MEIWNCKTIAPQKLWMTLKSVVRGCRYPKSLGQGIRLLIKRTWTTVKLALFVIQYFFAIIRIREFKTLHKKYKGNSCSSVYWVCPPDKCSTYREFILSRNTSKSEFRENFMARNKVGFTVAASYATLYSQVWMLQIWETNSVYYGDSNPKGLPLTITICTYSGSFVADSLKFPVDSWAWNKKKSI